VSTRRHLTLHVGGSYRKAAVAKKRKTPASPRAPFSHEDTRERTASTRKADTQAVTVHGVPHHARDTDEHELGDFHPDHATDEDTAADTEAAMPAVIVDDELLDLGSLGASDASPLDSGAYAALSVDGDASPDERRLTPTLLKIFSRRRQQIRLSLDQLARLSGISLANLEAIEQGKPGTSITYDQMVVLSRVLGVGVDQLPGLRRRETRSHLGVVLAELERSMLGAPLLRFEGRHGERYGGDVERAASSKSFTVRVEDESLEPAVMRGALLGFMSGVRPRPGGVLLLRHRRSALLALRRHEPPSYVGLVPWQPGYVVGGEWHLVGSLEVVLPPR